NKSHRFQHQTVRNKRAENAGVMRPEYAAHERKRAARQTFEHAGMIPEFELDDVGIRGQFCHMLEIFCDDDARAASFDQVRIAAVAWRFQQRKGLFHLGRKNGAHGRVRLSDAATQMRRDVKNLHSAATAVNLRLAPPGGSISGLTATAALNFSSKATRWASILSGRQWLSWPQLPQTPFCLRRPSRCCKRSAFIRSEFQICFIDWTRTSPITSLRPQSRKQELTRPSAFTE